VFNLHEDEIRIYDAARPERCTRFSGAVVSGAFRAPFVIDTREHRSMLGVHFKPGGAFPFLHLPVHHLAGTHVDLETLCGADARRLRDDLLEAETPAERMRLLEAALLWRLSRAPERRPEVSFAVARLERAAGGVRELAAGANLSHRRFIAIFENEVGLTPKLFGRTLRFQRALARARRAAAPCWTEIALACGYFDQSHLIRDFVAFSGLTPGDYVRRPTARVKENHVPIGDPGSIPSNNRRRVST
jgi:AraC-like DNA-binding protein